MKEDGYDALIVGARGTGATVAPPPGTSGLARVLLVDRASFPSTTPSTHVAVGSTDRAFAKPHVHGQLPLNVGESWLIVRKGRVRKHRPQGDPPGPRGSRRPGADRKDEVG